MLAALLAPELETLLLKYALPAVIDLLRKWGFIDAAEALTAKLGTDVIEAVRNASVEYVYPTGKNGQEG